MYRRNMSGILKKVVMFILLSAELIFITAKLSLHLIWLYFKKYDQGNNLKIQSKIDGDNINSLRISKAVPVTEDYANLW